MTLREKIDCMEAFERGEEVEHRDRLNDMWFASNFPAWNWKEFEYRIKPKPKQVVTIEKWLFEDKLGIKFVQEIEKDCVLCYCNEFNTHKVKLLDTYEVEL